MNSVINVDMKCVTPRVGQPNGQSDIQSDQGLSFQDLLLKIERSFTLRIS